MKRVTTIILGLAACLAFSFSGFAAAEIIDTVFFDSNHLIVNSPNRTIHFQGCDEISEAGRPDLPAARFFYHADGYPSAAHLTGRVLTADTVVLEFQPSVSSSDVPTSAVEIDPITEPLLVESHDIYPNNPFLDDRAARRGQTVWTLTVFPVQYLADGRIVFNRQIEVSVEDATGKINVCAGRPEAEESIVSRPLFSAAKSGAQYDGCPLGNDYVIVTSSPLAEAFKPLADLKRRTGFNPVIALVDSILVAYGGRDAAEAVRNYLHDFYLAGGRYVLLGGDETQVPIRYAYYYNTDSTVDIGHLMICDLYFADFDGEWDFDNDGIWGEPTQDHPDLGPDVALGRLPFSRPEQVAAYVRKLEQYLFNPGDGTRDYLNRAAFFVSDQMRDYGGTGQQVLVAANFPDGFQTDCASLAEAPSGNDPNPSAPSVANAEGGLSDGYGLVNILAHGRPDGFVLTSSAYNENPKTYILTGSGNVAHAGFENLVHNNKVGFYYSVACDQAAYDLETLYGMTVPSVTEELLNLDSAGAIGVIAFTRWGWVSSSHKLMSSFYQHLFGEADGYPVQAMIDSWQDYPYYRDQIYGQNYFGDPSLRLYTGIPQSVVVTVPETYDPHHPLECIVTLNGVPMAGQMVVADVNGQTYWTAVTDDDGVAAFVLPEENTDNIRLSVYVPGTVAATIETVPSIVADADDDDNPLPARFDLQQNFPNPFNPATTIRFSLARMGQVSLEIYNILGQLVATPVEGNLPAGEHDVVWEGRGRNGEPVSSGMYIYCLRSDEGVMTRTMALVK